LRLRINPHDWQLLKDAADQAYDLTTQMLARDQRDCLNVKSMRLPAGEQP